MTDDEPTADQTDYASDAGSTDAEIDDAGRSYAYDESAPGPDGYQDAAEDSDDRPAVGTDRPSPGDDRAPMADLAERVTGERELDEVAEELFEAQEPVDLDSDELWERLEAEEPPSVEADERTVHEVSKRRFCHQCDHFADPPTVACTNEGTEIVAMPSVSTFRVVGCPVAHEEAELEDRS